MILQQEIKSKLQKFSFQAGGLEMSFTATTSNILYPEVSGFLGGKKQKQKPSPVVNPNTTSYW